jgi:hypothetical protein
MGGAKMMTSHHAMALTGLVPLNPVGASAASFNCFQAMTGKECVYAETDDEDDKGIQISISCD